MPKVPEKEPKMFRSYIIYISQSPESRVQSPESRVQSPESRVQSPESRVQSSPVQLLDYAGKAQVFLTLLSHDFGGFTPRIINNREV